MIIYKIKNQITTNKLLKAAEFFSVLLPDQYSGELR